MTTSINIEGLPKDKEAILSEICKENETHRGITRNRPKVDGMKLVTERQHDRYGSAIFVKPNLIVKSTLLTQENDIEILTIELTYCTITSVYNGIKFKFVEPLNYRHRIQIVKGDFNCRNTAWDTITQMKTENYY